MKKPEDEKTASKSKAAKADKAGETAHDATKGAQAGKAGETASDATKGAQVHKAGETASDVTKGAQAGKAGETASDATKGAQAGKAAETASDVTKKPAAKPGAIKSSDVGSGDGSSAAATGGTVAPAESSLVGDPAKGRSAAKAKSPSQADAEGGGSSGGADKDMSGNGKEKRAEPGPKGPLKDVPPEAILRDTPASTPAPTQNVTVQKTGFWPVAFGGVVAAGIGAAATLWALPQLPAGWLGEEVAQEVEAAPQVDADAIRADAVAAAEAAAREQVEALRADATAAAEAAAGEQVEALRADATAAAEAAAREQVEALRAELAEAAATRPASEVPDDPAAGADDGADQTATLIAGLQARLEEQAARIEELAARPVPDPDAAERMQSLADQAAALEQQIQSAAEAARAQLTAAQEEAEKMQDAAAESTRRAEAVAAIASLQAALDRGVTPDEMRQTLADAGVEAPDALTREVPSLDRLQATFGDASRAALRATLREDSSSGGSNVLANFLRAQTGARSVAPREGDDPDAVLSRANAEVEAGRITAALDEIAALSDTARSAPAMAEWLEGATAYRDAHDALSDLSANSN
ncbi:hypothetical protein [Paracoccus salsus]|uniref:hypothetical protein n=1 Tax=Paracoccus salsus TaxID=2911061 RepID=UPI001F376C62|nr:hypothetical protein [Paracoccus salsus]MCF3973655.1 hypothetical protein [Paracoccus salsus]